MKLTIIILAMLPVITGACTKKMLGTQRDIHGCIPSAGYEWNVEKGKCVRPWENLISKNHNMRTPTTQVRL